MLVRHAAIKMKEVDESFFGFHQTTYFIFPYFVLYLMCKYLKDTKDIKQGRK